MLFGHFTPTAFTLSKNGVYYENELLFLNKYILGYRENLNISIQGFGLMFEEIPNLSVGSKYKILDFSKKAFALSSGFDALLYGKGFDHVTLNLYLVASTLIFKRLSFSVGASKAFLGNNVMFDSFFGSSNISLTSKYAILLEGKSSYTFDADFSIGIKKTWAHTGLNFFFTKLENKYGSITLDYFPSISLYIMFD